MLDSRYLVILIIAREDELSNSEFYSRIQHMGRVRITDDRLMTNDSRNFIFGSIKSYVDDLAGPGDRNLL